MNIDVRCPYCNGITGFDNSRPFAFCNHCGKQISLGTNQPNNYQAPAPAPISPMAPVQSMPPQVYSGCGANLVISYTSEHPRVYLIATILATGASYQFVSGGSMAFNLNPGIHPIDFKIGKRTYRRDILITPNGEPVRAMASWSRGTARITIINPTQPGSAPVIYT